MIPLVAALVLLNSIGGESQILESRAAISAVPPDLTCAFQGCWSTMTTGAASSHYAEFYSVSCSSPNFCVAVGRYDPSGNSIFQTLAEEWNGSSWSVMPTLNPGGPNTWNRLFGVSCTSPTFCMAVGVYGPNITYTLAEKWDGLTWSIMPTPNPGGTNNSSALYGVSCVAETFCSAVGYYNCTDSQCPALARSWNQPLAEEWDGVSWSIMPTPYYTDSKDYWLFNVSCNSTTFCMAVGENFYSATETFGEEWDGLSWREVVTTNPGEVLGYAFNSLTGVSCTSPTFCVAVGLFGDFGSGTFSTSAQEWTGSSWKTMTTINPALPTSGYEGLTAVSCVSARFCIGVGLFGPSPDPIGPYPNETFAEMWNGLAWSSMRTTNPGGSEKDNGFWGTSCSSLRSCVAVGYTNHSEHQPLVEHWTCPMIVALPGASKPIPELPPIARTP